VNENGCDDVKRIEKAVHCFSKNGNFGGADGRWVKTGRQYPMISRRQKVMRSVKSMRKPLVAKMCL
jgi:hypothetical protein